MKYIDVHSHIYFPDYDTDREDVISRARAADVGVINVGTDLESSRAAVAFAENHENMWAIIGLHPVDVNVSAAAAANTFDYKSFRALALHPKVVAIGECGLDYFHEPFDAKHQGEVFIRHIELANEVKKPLMLHVRSAKNKKSAASTANAYQDALEILKKYARTPFNFHFFAGSAADLKNIIDAGGSVSFTGVITFAREYDGFVKAVPLDRIMSETDAPFVSPASHRGERNEPSYVVEVAQKIAEIRAAQGEANGESREVVLTALVKNAKKFFSI